MVSKSASRRMQVLPKAFLRKSPSTRATLSMSNSYLFVEKVIAYLKDVQKEIKKVSWPSQDELIDYTIVVVVFTVILAVFIFAVDQLLSTVLQAIYS